MGTIFIVDVFLNTIFNVGGYGVTIYRDYCDDF